MARELALPTHGHCRSLTGMVQQDAARLQGRGRLRTYHAGELIYAMGEATDHIYLVVSGRVRTSLISPEGRELVIGMHGPGELFGELCFCSVRRRQEQAMAVAETTVARLEVEDLLGLAGQPSEGAIELLELFCHRMLDMQEKLAELAFASVRTRVGLMLLRLAEGAEPGPGGGAFCRENPTHEEMAARVNTTREQVSAILSQFREQGLVDYRRGGRIQVFADRLRAYLETA